MKKILALQGVPASGKTTWAKEFMLSHLGWVRVNRDDIRSAMSGSWSPEQEQHVKDIEDFIITSSLNNGKSVIVDDTNLNPKTIKHLRDLASIYECELEFKEFKVDFRTALERDRNREHSVGEKVLRNFFLKYCPEEMADKRYMKELDRQKPKCIICDLDGTLALNAGRDWFDYGKVITDKLDWRINDVLFEFYYTHDLIFITGRDEECREVTEKWINEVAGHENFKLYMRSHGDKRPDQDVKKELYEKYVEPHYNVSCVLEDRNKVVEMWRELGLLCLQVCDGNY